MTHRASPSRDLIWGDLEESFFQIQPLMDYLRLGPSLTLGRGELPSLNPVESR